MAKISGIYIGGKEGSISGIFYSGVSFALSSKSRSNKIFTFEQGNWEVELHQGKPKIVARCRHRLTCEKTIADGYRYCQEVLDLLSVANEGSFILADAINNYQVIYTSKDRSILRHFGVCDWSVGMEVKVEVVRDGKPDPAPLKPQLAWNEAFRYYRMSQASHDPYEAYRNLFLGLEALLSKICPKNHDEGEVEWLRRGLAYISSDVDLKGYVPPGKDPVAYFIKTQYRDIRCHLFHAKGNPPLLPYGKLTPTKVSLAYNTLLAIWRQIATVKMQVPSGGGVMTIQGFKAFLEDAFNSGVSFFATGDPTPINKIDEVVSPKGMQVFECKDSKYQWDQMQNYGVLTSNIDKKQLRSIPLIHRICSFIEGHMFTGSIISGGAETTGIDLFEVHLNIRLVNTSVPKTIFAN